VRSLISIGSGLYFLRCTGLCIALLIVGVACYAQEFKRLAEPTVSGQSPSVQHSAPLLHLAKEGIYIQGRRYSPEWLPSISFFGIFVLGFGLAIQLNQPTGSVLMRWFRMLPFILQLIVMIASNIGLSILGALGVHNAAGFMVAAPFFNIVCAVLASICLSGISHSGKWLGLMWAGFSLLQVWLLFMLFSNAQSSLWFAGGMLVLFSAVFLWWPLVLGLRMQRKQSLPVKAVSRKRYN
jgi:hypothetical protein